MCIYIAYAPPLRYFLGHQGPSGHVGGPRGAWHLAAAGRAARFMDEALLPLAQAAGRLRLGLARAALLLPGLDRLRSADPLLDLWVLFYTGVPHGVVAEFRAQTPDSH